MSFAITSPAFAENGEIPARYGCTGADVSPPLRWSGAPPATRSFVLIIDDPDAPDPRAPQRTWVHWVVYNLPAESRGLEENAAAAGLPTGTLQGLNDWRRPDYGGPCPPIGRHRYFHKLYALDVLLPDLRQPSKTRILAAMKGHILSQAQLIGLFGETHR